MPLLSDFDYSLPSKVIAQKPAEPRDSSRMLVLHRLHGAIEHSRFRDLPNYLRPGDLLVLNDTRVTALKLKGERPTGGRVEALLLREVAPAVFHSLMKPARRLRPGARIEFEGGLWAEVVGLNGDAERVIRFDETPHFRDKLVENSRVPLPPYVRDELENPERYQTVYAHAPGSSAAPTAGLHFTQELLCKLSKLGIETATITLNVGIDTFRPIQTENISEHRMHGERYCVPVETAEKVAHAEHRIIAVGTTSVRALESAAIAERRIRPGTGPTELFITPGYRFFVVNGLITNFHMPRTSMMLLVAAFCGRENLLRAYQAALERDYRFLSFGDSMLILPGEEDAKN